MSGRAVANSTLALGVLNIPVALHKISDPKEVTFDRAASGGEKVSRVETAEIVTPRTGEVTTVPVAREAIQYGARDENGVFHPISKEAIEEIEAATKLTTFEIETFIPMAKVPWKRGKETYYLTPQGTAGPGGVTPMRVLNLALRKAKVAGVMKICLTKRQHLAVVYADGDALYVTTLAWAEDWAQADQANILEGVKVNAKMVDVAVSLVKELTTQDADAALDTPVDDLRVLRAKLRDDALADRKHKPRVKKARKEAPANILDALEESLAAAKA